MVTARVGINAGRLKLSYVGLVGINEHILLGHTGFDFGSGVIEGVVHAEGKEDVVPDVVGKPLARDYFDDGGKDVVTHAVLPMSSGFKREGIGSGAFHCLESGKLSAVFGERRVEGFCIHVVG